MNLRGQSRSNAPQVVNPTSQRRRAPERVMGDDRTASRPVNVLGSSRNQTEAPARSRLLDDRLHSGRPLDAESRAFFEPRFGHDFGRVRLHDGAEADASAKGLNARAYAVGDDIVLGAQHPGLSTPQGMGLLAHELAHVVQQRSGGQHAGAEPGARATVAWLASGQVVPPEVVGSAPPGLYRQGTEESPPVPVDPLLLPPSLKAPAAVAAPAASPAPAAPQRFSTPAGGFQIPHLSELSSAVPKLPPPDLTKSSPAAPGPRVSTPPPAVFAALAPKFPNFRAGGDKKAAPSAPETLTVPGSDRVIKTAIRLSAPSPDTKLVAGQIPPAYVTAALQQAFVKAELTGNPPPDLDKGELMKIVYSIVSTYFLADITAKMAAAFTSKDKGASIQLEFTLNIPGASGATTVKQRFLGAGFTALSAGMLGIGGKF